jgi:2-amino-4-hydroxy-6-hydroxymethyldihydropteridine diphosphokinase
MNKVYLAFGSNIGESMKTIEMAFALLEQNQMKITKRSSIYETEPYGYKDQPNFVNGAVEIETELCCREVLKSILDIELKLGRVRTIHWGPRVIDLDIILYNNEIYCEEDLIVPHPDMQNRDFVLKPMNDLCPDFIHPILKKSMKEMLQDLKL